MDCSSEDECKPVEILKVEDEDLVYKIRLYEHDLDEVHEIRCSLCRGRKEIGYLNGYLIKARGWHLNFYSACDSISAEIQLISNIFFHKCGRLRKHEWDFFLSLRKIKKYSTGGFLNIEDINVSKEFRGNDYGSWMAFHTLSQLKGRFSFSIIEIVYTDECAPAEKIIKYERVCQMFQRLGYRQHPQKSAYWYLRPSQLSHQNKDVVFPDVVLPRQHQNQKNPYLKALTELIDAARKSDNIPALISQTIGNGLDLGKADAFTFMAYNNENELLKALLDNNGSFINKKNSLGDTPLHAACRQRNVDGIHLLLKYGADISRKNLDGIIPYEMLLLAIGSSNCFNEAFDLKSGMNVVPNYENVHSFLPPTIKSQLVGGLFSPKMFERLSLVAAMQSDMANQDMEDSHFRPRKIVNVEEININLSEYIPKAVVKRGVYPTFLKGFVSLMEDISMIMRDKRLPTRSNVLAFAEGNWPPSYRYYMQHGGEIKFILEGIIDRAKDSSWAYGDADYDDCHADDDEKLPKMPHFDDNFEYLETYVLDFLLKH